MNVTARPNPRSRYTIPLARNLAGVIDDLYRQQAPPRDHERLIALVAHHIKRAMWAAVREDRRRRSEDP
jgi:hypothetical protein